MFIPEWYSKLVVLDNGAEGGGVVCLSSVGDVCECGVVAPFVVTPLVVVPFVAAPLRLLYD